MKAAVDARVNAIARADQDKIFRRVIDTNVHKIFPYGERKVFGRIREADAGVGPTSAEAISAFTIERLSGVGLSQNSGDRRQLRPPYAIRPSTFSTARTPGSVSIQSSGARPPKARFGRLSHCLAFSSSPM